jgi:nucleoid-associated protein YgaU
MSPTKLLVEVVAIFLLAAPAALAGESAPTAQIETAEELSSDGADAPGPADVQVPEVETAVSVVDPEVEMATPAVEPETSMPAAAAEVETSMPVAGAEAAPEGEAPMLAETVEGADASASPEEAWSEPVPASMDPSAVEPMAAQGETGEMAAAPPALGAIGYDSEGRRGRIHIVIARDTLWDISNAYLGTSWVWPSIWRDNADIENPHLIHPGDHIWITPNEMRRVTPEEAALLLANQPDPGSPAAAEDLGPEPVLAEPTPELSEPIDRGSYRVSSRESAGLVTPDQLDASASIVDRLPERILMSQEDECFIGLGEGDVEVGDQLTIFRTNVKVFDPDTGRLLGYHVDLLGWLEVRETFPETSRASIRMSTGEIEVDDRVIPREPLPPEIAIQASPQEVEGKISFFPDKRVLMGFNDFVYLNRGTLDGLEVGSPLEVYRPGRMASESTRNERVQVPDVVVADMLVVRVEAESSVALVMRSNTELALGDRFRGDE